MTAPSLRCSRSLVGDCQASARSPVPTYCTLDRPIPSRICWQLSGQGSRQKTEFKARQTGISAVTIPFLNRPCNLAASFAIRSYCLRFACTNDLEMKSAIPGVEDDHACESEIAHIAGDHRHAMHKGRCRDECIALAALV